MNEIALAVRVLVGLVFLAAALGKLSHRLEFRGVLANYRLLPEILVPAVTLALPPVEIAVGVALLFAPTVWPEASAALLLLVFAAAMAINLKHGRRHIDCGCFQTSLKQSLSWTLVARNLVLAALLAVPAFVNEASLSESAAAEALLIGTVLFVLLQTLNILWSVVPAWQLHRAIPTGADK